MHILFLIWTIGVLDGVIVVYLLKIKPKQRLWYPFHISIFSFKMDDFPRKSNIPVSYSNV